MPRHQIPIRLGIICFALSGAGHLVAQTADDDRWVRQCDRSYSDADKQYCEVRHSSFKPSGAALTVDPDNNGGATVVGWDRDSVAISLRVQAGAASAEEARKLASEVTVEASGRTIRVKGPLSSRHHQWSADLVIMVPRQSGLTIETANGPISVRAVAGTMDLRAQNGPISLSQVSGDVRARSQNGPLSVSLAGGSWEGKGLDAETINGPVTLRLPAGYSAELETGTVNGSMQMDVPLTVTLKGNVRDRLRTTMGKGGPPVRVVTTNGPVTIQKGQDDHH